MNVFSYIYRGLKYASTSGATIFAGYLMQSEHVRIVDLLILSIPLSAAWFFFICYANRFDLRRTDEEQVIMIQQILEKNAVFVFLAFLAGWIVIALLLSARIQALPVKLLVSTGVYVLLFVYYGVFLLRYKTTEYLPLIRHLLVWPVVLSIGIGLYYGLSFGLLVRSYRPLLPIVLIVVAYVASRIFHWGRTTFVFVMLFAVLVITIAIILNLVGLFTVPTWITEYVSLMFFCLAVCAYLAVFEAWKVTAYVAAIENTTSLNLPKTSATPAVSDVNLRKSSQYALASLIALTITVWVLPLYFVFSDYGTFFLLAFALHALIAFVVWFYRGRGTHLKRSWDWIKVGFGLTFLGILVLASLTSARSLVAFRFLSGFADWGEWVFATTLTFLMIRGLIRDVRRRQGPTARESTLSLLTNRINFTRILSVLCIASSFATIAVLRSSEGNLARHNRAELAFYVYVLCILFCLAIEGWHSIRRKGKTAPAINSMMGFLLLIRIATSLVISLVVILPSLHEGVPLKRAILSALPFFLAAAGGFALNDYYDSDKDGINKPYRAIPSLRLTSLSALRLALFLIASAVATSLLAFRTISELGLYLVAIAGVGAYNYLVKHLTLSKNVVTSLVSALPIVFVVIVFHYPAIYLFVPTASLAFLLGREWLMDIRDMNGDSFSGIRTLPLLIGPERTAKLGFVSLGASIFLLLPLVVTLQTVWCSVLLVLMILSLVFLIQLWPKSEGAYRRGIVLGLWFPMSCGILMLIR